MNNVDIADQLRGSYQIDKCMRKRKWWRSMFFWGFQMLLTNSYIVLKNTSFHTVRIQQFTTNLTRQLHWCGHRKTNIVRIIVVIQKELIPGYKEFHNQSL